VGESVTRPEILELGSVDFSCMKLSKCDSFQQMQVLMELSIYKKTLAQFIKYDK